MTACRGSRSAAPSVLACKPIGYRVLAMHGQLAWYIGGPVLGLCVVSLRWLLNERLGATAAWSDVVGRLSARSVGFGVHGWLLLGLIAGGLIFGLAGSE